MLCSETHRYRLFFNLGILRPQGSHVLPQRLYCRFVWQFALRFETFDCRVERANWTEFSLSHNKPCERDSQGKSTIRTSAVLLWCETSCAEKARWRTSPYRVGDTFRRLAANCARYHVFESRQARYGSRQVGVGTIRCAELASQVFRFSIGRPQPKEMVILKTNVENAFNSINQQFVLAKTFEIHPDVYKFSYLRTVSQLSFFYGDTVIKFVKGPSKEILSLHFFPETIQDLIDSLE